MSSYSIVVECVSSTTFVFPESTQLISSVCSFSLSFSLSELNKPITFQLNHCADIKEEGQSECLSFVVASSSNNFKFLSGGTFTVGSQYGEIALKERQQLIAIVKKGTHSVV